MHTFYFPRKRVPNDWTNFIAFFLECSILILVTQNSVFQPNCAELLFTTKTLSKTSEMRAYLILNISISSCVACYFMYCARSVSLQKFLESVLIVINNNRNALSWSLLIFLFNWRLWNIQTNGQYLNWDSRNAFTKSLLF